MSTRNINRDSGGPRVKTLQKEVKEILKNHGFDMWSKVIVIDGKPGPMTFRMSSRAASMIGLSKGQVKAIASGKITPHAEAFLTHEKPTTAEMKRTAKKRDEIWDKVRHDLKHPPFDKDGISEWRGVAVPSWLVGQAKGPDGRVVHWLDKLVEAGWDGVINSGCRTPEHSEALCFGICGAPTCSGTCAGRSSNHVVEGPADWGALDINQFVKFAECCRRIGCPLKNALGPADPWHFSPDGH